GFREVVPEEFARQHNILPYNKTPDSIQVALSDPLNVMAIDNLRMMTRLEVSVSIATLSDIKKGLDELYGKEDLYKKAVERVEATKTSGEAGPEEKTDEERVQDVDAASTAKGAEEAPLIKLVDLIIMEAINSKTSDIHIERFENRVSIRYRIDGILYEMPPPATQFYPPLVSRIKLLSKMDIAEKRLPQDGGFKVKTKDKAVDLRVSTMPTIYGEKIVIRLLDKSQMTVGLQNLGFESDVLDKFKKTIKKPYGLVLITGPTGSGKTTTLYASLNELRSPQKNIVTLEDPVEYRLEGVNQVQIRPQIGLTFASGVRTFLRQDPDIMMVGEIRDFETAEVCIRAALAGRLVFSTLHTNNTAIAVTRLLEFGLEPFLITSSLVMVEAQRLVRKLCPACKQAYEPDEQLQKKYALGKGPLYKAAGCEKCRQIGYGGRLGIYEVMVINEGIRQLALKRAGADEIMAAAIKLGMKTLLDSGIEKVKLGLTSLEEVLSIVFTE
ncbi:MAG: type II/IV secretion system protein, partial [Candidatus Omnitrophica bacterium]|nr:type II/IV secretion system protein [Candidatus Omnitrophota bacterium]